MQKKVILGLLYFSLNFGLSAYDPEHYKYVLKSDETFFENLNLSGADFRCKNLSGKKFDGCNFKQARLEGADLKDTKFVSCILFQAFFRNAVFSRTSSFINCLCTNAIFNCSEKALFIIFDSVPCDITQEEPPKKSTPISSRTYNPDNLAK